MVWQAGSVNNVAGEHHLYSGTSVVCSTVICPASGLLSFVRTPSTVNGFFLGGYGSFLNQLFSRNFPNYSAGFQLNVPIRNRANQADLITDELNYRQSQIQDKQLQEQHQAQRV